MYGTSAISSPGANIAGSNSAEIFLSSGFVLNIWHFQFPAKWHLCGCEIPDFEECIFEQIDYSVRL